VGADWAVASATAPTASAAVRAHWGGPRAGAQRPAIRSSVGATVGRCDRRTTPAFREQAGACPWTFATLALDDLEASVLQSRRACIDLGLQSSTYGPTPRSRVVLSGDEISGRGGYRSRRKTGAAVLVSAPCETVGAGAKMPVRQRRQGMARRGQSPARPLHASRGHRGLVTALQQGSASARTGGGRGACLRREAGWRRAPRTGVIRESNRTPRPRPRCALVAKIQGPLARRRLGPAS
jgi:hypothetical protein